MNRQDPRLLTVKQCSAYLNIPIDTLYYYSSARIELPVVKRGRRIYYDMKDLEEYIEGHKRQPREVK